ncbi:hypothetical protein EW146_g909 [Bondarzewia mesenterica]|uniref:RING-type domain-containing protein n=1 Tax=Bondarzewia mesenterica TaxID=1095465 RepID=A0A4S4MBQ6_9AGAM|nr:hypothetical protein EW146_g909 [Bondarzewia mesenterica]
MPSIEPPETSSSASPRKRARSPEAEDIGAKKLKVHEDSMGDSDDKTGETSHGKKDKRKRKRKKRRASVIQRVAVVAHGSETMSSSAEPGSFASTSIAVVKPPSPAEFVQGSSSTSTFAPVPLPLDATKALRSADPVASPDKAHLTQALSEKTEVRYNQCFVDAFACQSPVSLMQAIRAHEALLSTLIPSLTCQICVGLLHKPFALSPCGHVACYDCLRTWFTTPPADAPQPPPSPLWQKKTCPHCRAQVFERPAEVWSIKDMVSAVAKSGLAVGCAAAPPENSLPPEAVHDPWHNIFRKPRPAGAEGVHLPHLQDMIGGGAGDVGMYDHEDGVYRCIDCMHEIWQGTCSECGREYEGHQSDWDDESVDGDHGPGFLEAMLFGLGGMPHSPEPDLEHHHAEDEDELDHDLSDAESYEGSFIDDGDDHGSGDHARDRRGSPIIDISSGSENGSEARELGRGWRNKRRDVVSDEEEDVGRGARREGRIVVDSDVDEDELASDHGHAGDDTQSQHNSRAGLSEEDDGSIARPPRRLAHLLVYDSPSPIPGVTEEMYFDGHYERAYSNDGASTDDDEHYSEDEGDYDATYGIDYEDW